MKLSGHPFSPNQSAPSFMIVFGTLLSILAAFTVTYNFFYNEKRLLDFYHNHLRFRNIFSSPVVFARFENIDPKGLVEDDDDVASVEIGYEDVSIENIPTSFNNPMFEEGQSSKIPTAEEEFSNAAKALNAE